MKQIKFVDVGEGITEGHIRKWLIKDDEVVKEDQPVVQVETDKAVVSVPSPIGGTLKQNVPENTTVHVGDLIASIGTPEEIAGLKPAVQPQPQAAPAAPVPTMKMPQPVAQPATAAMPKAQPAQKEVIATPAVRKLARDLNVDINQVTGTGPEGRILENDVRSHVASAIGTKPVPKFSEVLEKQHEENIERIPLSTTRKAIAKNMELSWTLPRAVHMDLLDADALVNLVARKRDVIMKEFKVKLTFMPFIIKATIEALRENPNFNASYDHETQEIIVKKYYNIGIAAQTQDGLKVIVVKDADKKSIAQLAKEMQAMRERLDKNTITLDEMRDSTVTITNIGSLGGGFLSVPMINYPEVAILGIHLIRDWPVIAEGQVQVGKILPISLSFDHRVVDGADAVRFGNAIKKYLEDPEFLEMVG